MHQLTWNDIYLGPNGQGLNRKSIISNVLKVHNFDVTAHRVYNMP